MSTSPALILASASPRRRQYLAALGLSFQVHTSAIDETPLPAEKPISLVKRLSWEKALAVACKYPEALVIAADTIVVLGDEILGKPANAQEATTMLMRLRSRNHFVYSAITLYLRTEGKRKTLLSRTQVTMRPYSRAEIAAYVASGDPLDKAGAYAIQHPTFAPVAQLDGCYAGVVGLSLGCLAQGLAHFGLTIPQVGQKCEAQTGQPCCQYSPNGHPCHG